MGIPAPRIESEKSGCDTEMEKVRGQLKETLEIEEKIREMIEGEVELQKFASVCVKCRAYCASYVCPFCLVFLHCVLCVERGAVCPACRNRYNEPLRIQKTCFFGKEFEIELHRKREASERAAADKQ
jgi:hypothetical protein